ncbi:MAG TPA: succinate dehydrogenase, cytochrome b556 subunit [Steroidobacteraceae bacterium]
MPSRPLSPHLSVYKFKYTLVSSILNRFSGIALSVGCIALTYWLLAVAAGARAQAHAQALLCTPLARLFLAAMVIAFCYHLVAGIRHLVWDTGRGLERTTAQKSAWLVGLLSIVLMLLIFYWLWRGGHAP